MVKAESTLDKEKSYIACSVEVDGRGDIVLHEMAAIVQAFVKSNLQQAKPGHEMDVSLLIGRKLLDAVAESTEDFMKLKAKEVQP